VHATTAVRAVLAVVLLAGFYVLGLGVLAFLMLATVWLMLMVPGQLGQAIGYLTAATGAGLVVSMWMVARIRPEPPDGTPVTEQQAPALWSQVRELAEAAGTSPPDEIRLSFAANAWVWEDTGPLGLRAGRRLLYLGVPFVQAMTVAQLRAVIGHELGHYSALHTRSGALTYRGSAAIIHTIEQVGRSLPGLLLSAYAAVYFWISLAVTRAQEFEADSIAVRVAGRDATALALRDAPRLDLAWQTYLSGYVTWSRRHPYTHADLLSWFGWWLTHRWPDVEPTLPREDGPPPPWDSHPPIDVRIARLAAEPREPVRPDERPGTDLVDDPDALVSGLRADAFDYQLEQLTEYETVRQAEWLYKAVATMCSRHGCVLGCALDLLAAGRQAELREASGLDQDELTDLVHTAAAVALVASGAARWRHAPPALLTPVDDANEPIDVLEAVASACRDPASVEPLRARLRELGVDAVALAGPRHPVRKPLETDIPLREELGRGVRVIGDLLLPDELYLLTNFVGRKWLTGDNLRAALAAAVLAELRLRGHVTLTDTPEATVLVRQPDATGDRFLDSVLGRIAAAPQPLPAYQWVQALGEDVTTAVARRLDAPVSRAALIGRFNDIRARAYIGIPRALATHRVDDRDLVLGKLLWATEQLSRLYRRVALVSRFRLGRVAARDPLAMAIRIVVGIHMPLPSASGTPGY
jgi:Zn-dependent protease with chaperone function